MLSKTEKSSIKDYKKLWGQRRLNFKDKRLLLPENPRKDNCDWCSKGIGDEYTDSRGRVAKIKRMHTHHIKYHEDDPLKDTYTLCPSCHLTEERRLRKLREKPRMCSQCSSNKTKIQTKRYPSGYTIEYNRWERNPETKNGWVCFNCYNKIKWRLSKGSVAQLFR
jgi:hypothetical protein